jgi:hypothetical protein
MTQGQEFRSHRTQTDLNLRAALIVLSVVIVAALFTLAGYYLGGKDTPKPAYVFTGDIATREACLVWLHQNNDWRHTVCNLPEGK